MDNDFENYNIADKSLGDGRAPPYGEVHSDIRGVSQLRDSKQWPLVLRGPLNDTNLFELKPSSGLLRY